MYKLKAQLVGPASQILHHPLAVSFLVFVLPGLENGLALGQVSFLAVVVESTHMKGWRLVAPARLSALSGPLERRRACCSSMFARRLMVAFGRLRDSRSQRVLSIEPVARRQ